jgi:hypothetical protein
LEPGRYRVLVNPGHGEAKAVLQSITVERGQFVRIPLTLPSQQLYTLRVQKVAAN